MKKMLMSAMVMLVSVVCMAAGEIKFIDFERVFSEYHENFKMFNQHMKYREEMIAGLKLKEEAMKKLDEERKVLEAKSITIGVKAEERNAARQQAALAAEQLRNESINLNKMVKTVEENIVRNQRRIVTELYTKLSEVVEKYRDEKQFLMIIDVSSKSIAGSRTILAYDKANDITDEILEHVNKGHEEFVKEELKKRELKKLEAEALNSLEGAQK